MNFQNNARKGNSTGKATLGGCLFILVVTTNLFLFNNYQTLQLNFLLNFFSPFYFFPMQAAYFDYFVVDRTNIQPTLPRILVWDDIAILNYSGAQSATKDIRVPPVYFFIMSKFIFYFVFHSLFFEKKFMN